MTGPSLTTSNGIYVCVGTREPVKLGYTWRMWWGKTSFYLKPRASLMGGWKISLHGPDPRHPRPGYKLALDGAPPPADQVLVHASDGFLPCWFDGEPTPREDARRVARLRWTSELFAPEAPNAPNAGNVGKGFAGALLAPPPPGFATDVDLIVAKSSPYYGENTEDVFRNNAVIGPIRSDAGEYLTGIVVRRNLETTPTPENLVTLPPPASPEDASRSIAAGLSQHGFIWICEALVSRTALAQAQAPVL